MPPIRVARPLMRTCSTPPARILYAPHQRLYTERVQLRTEDFMNRFGNSFLSTLAVCFSAVGALAAHPSHNRAAQDKTQKPAVAQLPTAADFPQEPYVIEKYETTARFESDGTGERDISVRIHVNSDAGVQQLGELVFGFNSA